MEKENVPPAPEQHQEMEQPEPKAARSNTIKKLQKSLTARSDSFRMPWSKPLQRRPTISYPLERPSDPPATSHSMQTYNQHHQTNNSVSTGSVLTRHSSRPSNSSQSTAPTSVFPSVDENHSHSHPEDESVHACERFSEDWFARFRDDVDVSDDCPTKEKLDQAGEIPVYDQDGNSRLFKSFYSGETAIGQRQLVLFVRHFYCGACQAYLKEISESITPRTYFTMNIPTSIIIIGCGNPNLIPMYRRITGTPFPIFAEPTRKLYKVLDMSISLDLGSKRPEYMKDISIPAWMAGQYREIKKMKGRDRFRGGNLMQIGGEFLLEEREVVWCHRMRNYRDHAEIDALKRVLEIDDD